MLVADQTGSQYGDSKPAASKTEGLTLAKKPAVAKTVVPADEGTESVTAGIQALAGEKKLSVVEQLRARAAAAKAAQAE